MYSKYPGLDMIQRIHSRCELIISFKSIIRFWILVKKRNIRFRIKIRIWILVKKRTLTDHPLLSTYCYLPPLRHVLHYYSRFHFAFRNL